MQEGLFKDALPHLDMMNPRVISVNVQALSEALLGRHTFVPNQNQSKQPLNHE
jgi:hypothetical protein